MGIDTSMQTIEAVWALLAKAAGARSPYNFLQLASAGLDGAPQVRTVVLRHCDPAAGTVAFVTDIRSAKVKEIAREPRVALLGYDGEAMAQIRMTGEAALVGDLRQRQAMWAALRGRTHVLFEAPLPPGTPIDAGGVPLSGAGAADGMAPFERFALVSVRLTGIDWLDLAAEPHVRCAFRRSEDGWAATRLSP